MLKLYGYKQCGTCRKAEQFLQQAEIAYEFVDITEILQPGWNLLPLSSTPMFR